MTNPALNAIELTSLYRRQFLKAGLALATAGTGALSTPAAGATQGKSQAPQEYRVVWAPERIAALKQQILTYQFPRSIPGSGWRYGADPAFMRALCDYWVDGFDFEEAADNLNRHPQFVTRVDDIDIHFVRVTGENPAGNERRPLLLTHGWPGSTFEFWDVIEPLAFPSRHGGRAEDAFDLVIPSLPGYGPSGKPVAPIGARTTARLFDKLMREVLGHDTYYAQGGDWGAGVTGWLAINHASSLRAIHLNLMIAATQLPPGNEQERQFYRDAEEHERRLGGYYHLQATHPQSLAYGMVNDPVAQAAWLVERFYAWSDQRTRRFEEVFPMKKLLTSIMIYIMNDAFQTSTWFYTGCYEESVTRIPDGQRVTVPTGFAAYPGDSRSPNPPRSIVAKGYNLAYWSEVQSGGHFAAMEVPKLFVEDIWRWSAALGKR